MYDCDVQREVGLLVFYAKKNQLSLSAPARSEPLSLFHCHSPGNSEYKLVFFLLSVSAEEKSTLCCFFFFFNDVPFLFIVSFSK